jgi:hypothetical protein
MMHGQAAADMMKQLWCKLLWCTLPLSMMLITVDEYVLMHKG